MKEKNIKIKIEKKKNTKKRFTNFIKRWTILLILIASILYIAYSILHGLYYFSRYNPNRYIILLAVLGVVLVINDTIAQHKKEVKK